MKVGSSVCDRAVLAHHYDDAMMTRLLMVANYNLPEYLEI
jgi:hypothetical protein